MGLSSKQVSADNTLDWSKMGELDIPELNNNNNQQQQQQQKRPLLKCPRCQSTNTKFCYYNNYSKQQPRHFCRTCKRHWTEGGTLRNVPVGGCRRRNKRAKTSHDRVNNNEYCTDQQQQQQVAVPFSWEIETAIFPDIFRQLLMQPPLPSPPQLLPEIGVTDNFYSACISANSSSSLQELVRSSEESMLSLMDGCNNGESWLQDSLAQSVNYWNCWDGMEFDNALEIKLSTPDESN